MTAVEYLAGFLEGVKLISKVKFLSWWQKGQLVILKAIAIVGYHSGKWVKPQQSVVKRIDNEDWNSIRMPYRCTLPQKAGGVRRMAIVVPVYITVARDMVLLLQMLCGLANQSRHVDVLIVVDDASLICLPTFQINAAAQCLVMRLQENCGPAGARNTGLKLAHMLGVEVVSFLDADCLPHPDWLDRMHTCQQHRCGIVCGRTLASRGSTFIGKFHDIFGTLNGRKLPDGSLLYGCTCNLSVHLPSVEMLFDLNFGDAAFEDVEFCVRARKRGLSLAFAEEAVVWHNYSSSMLGLFQQFHRYGRNEGLMVQLHREYLQWLWSSVEIPSIALQGEKEMAALQPPVLGPVSCVGS